MSNSMVRWRGILLCGRRAPQFVSLVNRNTLRQRRHQHCSCECTDVTFNTLQWTNIAIFVPWSISRSYPQLMHIWRVRRSNDANNWYTICKQFNCACSTKCEYSFKLLQHETNQPYLNISHRISNRFETIYPRRMSCTETAMSQNCTASDD